MQLAGEPAFPLTNTSKPVTFLKSCTGRRRDAGGRDVPCRTPPLPRGRRRLRWRSEGGLIKPFTAHQVGDGRDHVRLLPPRNSAMSQRLRNSSSSILELKILERVSGRCKLGHMGGPHTGGQTLTHFQGSLLGHKLHGLGNLSTPLVDVSEVSPRREEGQWRSGEEDGGDQRMEESKAGEAEANGGEA